MGNSPLTGHCLAVSIFSQLNKVANGAQNPYIIVFLLQKTLIIVLQEVSIIKLIN